MKTGNKTLTLEQAGEVLGIQRKELAFILQDNKIPEIGFAYKKPKARNWTYVIWKDALAEFMKKKGLRYD